jgi:Ala-tRNA(Pro) deacylase
MPVNKKLKELFDRAKISYEVHNRPLASTTQKIARHGADERMAKVVMLAVDGDLAMSVVVGNQRVHLPTVCASLGAREALLVDEEAFASRFSDCEIGALPPFGNLFGLPVYLDLAVAEHDELYFSAGNHAQTVRIHYRDYERLVRPRVVRLTEEKKDIVL